MAYGSFQPAAIWIGRSRCEESAPRQDSSSDATGAAIRDSPSQATLNSPPPVSPITAQTTPARRATSLSSDTYSGFRLMMRRVADAAQFRVFAQINARADSLSAVTRKTTLGQRHRQSAVAAIVRRKDETRLNRLQADFLYGLLGFEVESWDRAARLARHASQNGQQLTRAQIVSRHAQQQDRVARFFEPLRGRVTRVLDQAEHADDGSRIDSLPFGLVVKTDVAAGDRSPERATSPGHSVYRLAESPHHFRAFGAGEVQAVGDSQRPRATAHHVARGFGDGQFRPFARVQAAVTPVAIERHRQGAPRLFHPQRRRVGTRRHDRVRPHHVVVLAVDPAL